MKSKRRQLLPSSVMMAFVVVVTSSLSSCCCCYYYFTIVVTATTVAAAAAVLTEGNYNVDDDDVYYPNNLPLLLPLLQEEEETKSLAASYSSAADASRKRRLRGSRTLQDQEDQSVLYLATHPYYPHHTTLTCLNDGNPPSWMTWSGGYAEAHLFSTAAECCDKWFPDNGDCYTAATGLPTTTTTTGSDSDNLDEDNNEEGLQEEGDNLAAINTSEPQQVEVTNYHPRPVVVSSEEEEGEETTTITAASRPTNTTTTTLQQTSIQQKPKDTTTFPTSSCGRTLFEARDCTRLCLHASSSSTTDNKNNNCLPDETCYPNILCPAKQVAAAMGEAGSAILNLIYVPETIASTIETVNICGTDYNDAESKCTQVDVTGEVEYITDGAYIECPDGTGKECPSDMQCFGGIICPLKPTSSPTLRPTVVVVAAAEDAVVAASASTSTTTTTTTTTKAKKDKTEVVGLATPTTTTTTTTTNNNNNNNSPPSTNIIQESSPYSIDKSTLGTVSVASESCNGGCPPSSQCVGNQAAGQLIEDSECIPCSTSGQTWWPCDVPGLCWCWKDGTDRIAPAPPSGLEVDPSLDTYYTVCDDILSREVFDRIAPDSKSPYTYTGLCDAILSYNAHHAEKAFGMGDAFLRASELASFLGNTLHESDEYKAPREYLMCGDNKIVNGEVYCKPCDSGSFDWGTHKCSVSLAAAGGFSEYCQSSSKPPEACSCGSALGDGEGYVPAKDMFFGRGSIQLSWNYNYISASIALTGSPETFCENPDLVATEEKYAWGAGLYFWMEHVKEGTTSHTECLKNYNFGGSLNNINGGLECPAHGGWHEEAVKMRLNRYCRAAKALGLPNLLLLDGCAGLDEKFQHCIGDGSCSDCTDFLETNPGEHSNSYIPPVSSPTTTAVVEQPGKPTESLCPEGLMHWEKNPSCCVPNPNFIGDGACDPDAPYNTEECGYDGGDCCKGTCDVKSIFGCTTTKESQFGDYGPFGFYCVDPSQEDSIDRSGCADVDKDRIGDGMCDTEYNTAECNYDGGDCCKDSCDAIHSFYQCGLGVDSFVCRDPAFATVVETDKPTAKPSTMPTTKSASVQTNAPSSAMTKTPTPPPTKEATSPMSNAPTSALPTSKAPTSASPTSKAPTSKAPTSASPTSKAPTSKAPTSASPTSKAPTLKAPTSKAPTTSPAHSTCHKDMLECGDGTFVARDPSNGCEFFPCPEPKPAKVELTETDSEVIPTYSPTETVCREDFFECSESQLVFRNPGDNCNFFPCPKECQKDMLECSGGRFVYRNPGDNCNFYPCPVQETPKPTPGPTQKIYTMASSVHEKLSTTSGCNAELFRCPDGRYVGRDPANTCEYFPCKVDEDIVDDDIIPESGHIPAMSSAAMTQDEFTSNAQQQQLQTQTETEAITGCKKDFLKCSEGQLVFRNPGDNCNFFPCPKQCKKDLLECSGGRFVYRNPGDNCNFYPCPVQETPKPTPGPTQKIYTMASSVHEKLSTTSGCNAELFRCPDGRYVGRDPANTCEYFPCKVDEDIIPESEHIPAMSSAAMTQDEFTSNAQQQQLRTHDKKRSIGG